VKLSGFGNAVFSGKDTIEQCVSANATLSYDFLLYLFIAKDSKFPCEMLNLKYDSPCDAKEVIKCTISI
jgi:hypothetical protein